MNHKEVNDMLKKVDIKLKPFILKNGGAYMFTLYTGYDYKSEATTEEFLKSLRDDLKKIIDYI